MYEEIIKKYDLKVSIILFKTKRMLLLSLFVLCILSINCSPTVGATVKVTFHLLLLGGIDVIIAVLVGTLHVSHFILV